MSGDPQDLISVYKAANSTDAHIVRNVLAENDIEARVVEDSDWFQGTGFAQPDVLVHRKDEAAARRIVAEHEASRRRHAAVEEEDEGEEE